mmetsp:Transcript_57557/g.168569  ORF Transcript_57557/g.168569 Transcript_57557/m.168569 type:complete len:95 (+) Transcript_57557:390-674(+)
MPMRTRQLLRMQPTTHSLLPDLQREVSRLPIFWLTAGPCTAALPEVPLLLRSLGLPTALGCSFQISDLSHCPTCLARLYHPHHRFCLRLALASP